MGRRLSYKPQGMAMADKTLDTKGLNCPLPILKCKKAIQELRRALPNCTIKTDNR